MADNQFPLRISPGTQVVTRSDHFDSDGALLIRAGTVGAVVDTDNESYLVEFPTGARHSFLRSDLKIRKAEQSAVVESLDPASAFSTLVPNAVCYSAIVGSRAYGLATDLSDTDIRGVFVAPPALLWSLQGTPDHVERLESEEFYWELKQFMVLALKANPNVLEVLSSPLVQVMDDIGQRLVSERRAFLSKLAYQTYNGYVLSQFKKLEQDIRNHGAPKWKHVMHLIRLLYQGIELLRSGELVIDVGERREMLLAIRSGETSWDTVETLRQTLHREFEDAAAETPLPERPDVDKVERLLISFRQEMGTK